MWSFDPDVASPSGSPASPVDILMSIGLLAFIGVMMYIAAVRYEDNYDKEAKWWKWCFAPLGLAMYFGIQKLMFMRSLIYMNTIISKKALYAHYMSPILPIVCIALILLVNYRRKTAGEKRVY